MDSIAEERHIHMAKYAWQYFCEAGLHCFSKLFALGRNRDRATVSLRRNAPLEPPPSNDGSICRSSWGSASRDAHAINGTILLTRLLTPEEERN